MENVLQLREDTVTHALRWFVGLLSSPEKTTRPVRLRTAYARQATDEVLHSADLEDLLDRLDALAGDDGFWEHEAPMNTIAVEQWSTIREKIVHSTLDVDSLQTVLGPTATQRCERGWEAFKTAVEYGDRLKTAIDKLDMPAPSPKGTRPGRLTDVLYDVTIPARLRQFTALLLRSLACAMVIGRAEERGERLDPWLALGLANAWAEPPERFAATVSDPATLAAWFTRLLSETNQILQSNISTKQWISAATAAAQPIYFPFAIPD